MFVGSLLPPPPFNGDWNEPKQEKQALNRTDGAEPNGTITPGLGRLLCPPHPTRLSRLLATDHGGVGRRELGGGGVGGGILATCPWAVRRREGHVQPLVWETCGQASLATCRPLASCVQKRVLTFTYAQQHMERTEKQRMVPQSGFPTLRSYKYIPLRSVAKSRLCPVRCGAVGFCSGTVSVLVQCRFRPA